MKTMKVSGKFNVRSGAAVIEREVTLFTKDGISMVENMGFHFFVVADKLFELMSEEKDNERLRKMESGVLELIEKTYAEIEAKKTQMLSLMGGQEPKVIAAKKYRDVVKVFSGELNRILDVLEQYDRGVFVSETGYLMRNLSMSQCRISAQLMKKDIYRLYDGLVRLEKGIQEARAKK